MWQWLKDMWRYFFGGGVKEEDMNLVLDHRSEDHKAFLEECNAAMEECRTVTVSEETIRRVLKLLGEDEKFTKPYCACTPSYSLLDVLRWKKVPDDACIHTRQALEHILQHTLSLNSGK